jgi:hypothetical protein
LHNLAIYYYLRRREKMKKLVGILVSLVMVFLVSSCNNLFYSSSFVRLATQDNLDKSNTLTDHWVYKYDSAGKLLSVEDYSSSNSLKGTSVYSYNSNGKRISTSSYSSTNALIGYSTYEYNNDGTISKYNSFYVLNGSYTTVSSYTVFYFSNSRKTKIENYTASTGKLNSSMTFSYDALGRRAQGLYSDGYHYDWTYPSDTKIIATLYDTSKVIQNTRTLNFESGSTTDNYLDYMNF